MMALTTRAEDVNVIPQSYKWRREATGRKIEVHGFIAFRNFLTYLREEHVIWTLWASVMN